MVQKKHGGQRATFWWHPAIRTKKCFETLTKSSLGVTNQKQLKHLACFRRKSLGCEQQRLLPGVLPVFRDMGYRLQRALSNVLLISPSYHRKITTVLQPHTRGRGAIAKLHTDKICGTLQRKTPTIGKVIKQIFLVHAEHNPDQLGLLLPSCTKTVVQIGHQLCKVTNFYRDHTSRWIGHVPRVEFAGDDDEYVCTNSCSTVYTPLLPLMAARKYKYILCKYLLCSKELWLLFKEKSERI